MNIRKLIEYILVNNFEIFTITPSLIQGSTNLAKDFATNDEMTSIVDCLKGVIIFLVLYTGVAHFMGKYAVLYSRKAKDRINKFNLRKVSG